MAIAARDGGGSMDECDDGRRWRGYGPGEREERGLSRPGERDERARLRGGSVRTGGRLTRDDGDGGRWWPWWPWWWAWPATYWCGIPGSCPCPLAERESESGDNGAANGWLLPAVEV